MLCAVCISMFQDEAGKGLHHENLANLLKAAEAGCRICLYLQFRRQHDGPDEHNEKNTTPFLTYDLQLWRKPFREPRWVVFFHSRNSWIENQVMGRPARIHLYILETGPMPKWYSEYLPQVVTEDLKTEPWKVREDEFPSKRIPAHTGHEATTRLAKGWLESCLERHESCERFHPDRDPTWRPKRLIDVGDSDTPPRLVLRDEKGGLDKPYATLSHCWGPNPSFLTLTSENLEEFRKQIPFEKLARNFQDAITTTRRLGIKYLWIDSLCIIQAGEGSAADWGTQALEMHAVYLNCCLNLAISHGANAQSGAFVERNTDFLQDCLVYTSLLPRPEKDSSSLVDDSPRPKDPNLCVVFTDYDFDAARKSSALETRAWVLQERLLSPRSLIFDWDRISWQCTQTHSLNEYEPTNIRDMERVFRGGLAVFNIAMNQDKDSLIRLWWKVVADYSLRGLTYPVKDKFIALSALSRRFGNALESDYLAGLFRCDLPWGLLWQSNGDKLLRQRAQEYRAPSWSWASMDSEVEMFFSFEQERCKPLVTVESVEVLLADDKNEYGQIQSAQLQLRGVLAPLDPDMISKNEAFFKGKEKWGMIPTNDIPYALSEDTAYQSFSEEHLFLLPIALEVGQDTSVERSHGLVLKKVSDGRFERKGSFQTELLQIQDYTEESICIV